MADIPKPNFNNGLWASGGAIVAPSNVKITTGWTAEVPPFQWENYSQNRQDQGIAHILQHGISVWDSLTEYQAGKSYVQGSDGLIYKALQTNTNINPVTDTTFTNWQKGIGSGTLIGVRVFNTPGATIYTPTPGTNSVRVRVLGGGGAGGGAAATGAGAVSVGSGGTAGAYAESRLTTGFSGVTVTVGAGGTPVSGTNGNAGGASSFGALISAPGGSGGQRVGPTAPPVGTGSGAGGPATGGNILNTNGGAGGLALSVTTTAQFGGIGGVSALGGGGTTNTTGVAPGAAGGIGGGGGGASQGPSAGALSGGAGAPGIVIIEEWT